MIEKMMGVVQLIESSGLQSQADLLKRAVVRLRDNKQDYVPSTPPPKPIFSLPLNLNSVIGLSVTDLDPLEIARQITLKEFKLLKVICPKECLNQAWVKSGKE
jgi:hypothetical protein